MRIFNEFDQILKLPSQEADQGWSLLELYRLVIERQNIGLMIGRKSEFHPLNQTMEVLLELFGRDLFLPKDAESWQVEFQPGTEQCRHFNLSRIDLGENAELIIVCDVTNNFLQVQSADRLLKEARHNATHDQLTGLANRAYLLEYAQQTLLEGKRTLERFAIFVLDLDEFKWINDQWGHNIGDQALCWVAQRLQSLCRDSDFIARQGGDEFCIIQRNVKTLVNVTSFADKLVHGLCDNFTTTKGTISTSVSIGVAVYPGDGAEVETLLHHADKALYDSKEAGRNCFRLYSRAENLQVVKEAALKTSLYAAFDKNEFQLRYQPIYEMGCGKIIGVEAFARYIPSQSPWSPLLRSDQDENKSIRSGAFLHLMERMGKGKRLFRWLARVACEDLAKWRKFPEYNKLTVSLNCSLRQLKESNILSILNENLASQKLPQDSIVIELKEDVFVSEEPNVLESLELLRASDITVVLDGLFCSDTTPLLLRKWKPDRVKLDMSRLTNKYDSMDDQEFIADLVKVARQLSGAPVHAGRVETSTQLTALEHSGCEVAQGYLFSKSLDAATITRLLSKNESMVMPSK